MSCCLINCNNFLIDENVSTSKESIAVGDEAGNNEATTECANGCHCHQHDYAPIRVRPSKKSKNFHLTVITYFEISKPYNSQPKTLQIS